MEIAVASGILKIVGNKLAPLLIKKYSNIVGAKKDLQELHDQVMEINNWLESVGDKAVVNDPSFNWLKELKGIAYEVDDIVDEFQLKAEKHDTCGDGGILYKYLCTQPKLIKFQCKASIKINSINKEFTAIVKQRNNFSSITNSSSVGHLFPRVNNMTIGEMPLLPNIDAESMIGRDKEKQALISKLVEMEDQQIINIVSIIGLGGSGKTCLAKLVFNDNIIEKHFDVKLWVHVSHEFDFEKLVGKLFEAISGEKCEQNPFQKMSKTIVDNLTRKRYLLVLDDIWTEDKIKWDQFMAYLNSVDKDIPGSGILLTTRNRNVADVVGSTYQFDLPFLSKDDSWKLFQQSLLMPANGLEVEFAEVGKQIVKKCGGVPLAIKVLAGVLHNKKHIEQWKDMRENNLLDAEGEEYRVLTCLRMSYLHLPTHLKQCFTICSLFPKGYMIDKEKLIDQWIAHDMIIPVDGVDYLEYIGNDYFNSLVQMSFLQDVNKKYDGRVECRMHDLVHDLARSILDDQISLDVAKKTSNFTNKYRYFSLCDGPRNILPENLFQKACAVYAKDVSDSGFIKEWKNANHLRSVTVEYVPTKTVLAGILQLKNLRYLGISKLRCRLLPEAISNMWSLQVLHLTYSDLIELPESIGKLRKLRTLNLSHSKELKCLPNSIGDCYMLSRLDLQNCIGLPTLPNSIQRNEKLRVLRLGGAKIKILPSSVTTMKNLECLDLGYCLELVELPREISNLENIQVLNLEGCVNLVELSKGISNLKKLQVLNLNKCEKLVELPEGIGNLKKLQVLNLNKCEKLVELPEGIGNLKKLQVLNLKCCTKLVELPKGISHLEKLQVLNLECCSSLRGMPVWIGQLSQLQNLDSFVVCKSNKFARISELGNVNRIGRKLSIIGISHVMNPNDAHMACLKQKTNLQRLDLNWRGTHNEEVNTKFDLGKLVPIWEKDVLDGLEPPPQIKEMGIHGYLGRQCARWMQNQVGGRAQRLAHFPFLRVMKLHFCQNLKHLCGLVELPCLEELELRGMLSLESISGGPFPSLVKLKMHELPCLGELWMVAEGTMPNDGENGGGRCNLTPQLAPFRVSNCLTESEISDCPKLKVKPHLPPSLQHLYLSGSSEELLRQSTRECQGSFLSPSFSHLKKLQLCRVKGLQCGHGWELLQHMTILESLEIKDSNELTRLPESLRCLTSLMALKLHGCHAIIMLPEWLGELQSLQELTICTCRRLRSLPQSMRHLTSLQFLNLSFCDELHQLPDCLGELYSLRELVLRFMWGLTCLPQSISGLASLRLLSIADCRGIRSLPEGMKDLTALQTLRIRNCPDLYLRCEGRLGVDWHLISHIPDVDLDPFYNYYFGEWWQFM